MPGSPYVLWDSGSGVSGEIDFMNIINVPDATLQICVDNDFSTSCATPSVNASLLDWVPVRGNTSSSLPTFATRYFIYMGNNIEGAGSEGTYIRVPFQNHVSVSIAGATGQVIWWNIKYHLNSLNWGLYSHLHASSVSGGAFSVSNGPGVIWGLNAWFGGVLGTVLETRVGWTIDGVSTITASGTEDFFESSFDWTSGTWWTDFAGNTYFGGSYGSGIYAHPYLLYVLDPIIFNSTAVLNNLNATNSLVWYYTQN